MKTLEWLETQATRNLKKMLTHPELEGLGLTIFQMFEQRGRIARGTHFVHLGLLTERETHAGLLPERELTKVRRGYVLSLLEEEGTTAPIRKVVGGFFEEWNEHALVLLTRTDAGQKKLSPQNLKKDLFVRAVSRRHISMTDALYEPPVPPFTFYDQFVPALLRLCTPEVAVQAILECSGQTP